MCLFRTDCGYCGKSGADETCNGCGMAVHYDCGKRKGYLQVKQESEGIQRGFLCHRPLELVRCPTFMEALVKPPRANRYVNMGHAVLGERARSKRGRQGTNTLFGLNHG